MNGEIKIVKVVANDKSKSSKKWCRFHVIDIFTKFYLVVI